MANTESAPAVEPLFRYHRAGFTFEVFPNRLEIAERKMFSTKRETVPIRKISSVSVVGVSKSHLEVATDDGKKAKWLLGTDAPAARAAIVELL